METPSSQLHEAIPKGDLAQVSSLITAGEDVNQLNNCGQTPLHVACCLPYFPVEGVEKLLEAGAATCIDKEDADGFTPLHIAAAGGRCAVVRTLLARRADMYKKSRSGQTSLWMALLKDPATFLFPQTRSGVTTSSRIKEDKLLCARVLLKAGFDLKRYDNDDIPLLVQVIGSRFRGTDMLRMLLEHGADPNKGEKNGRMTPLIKAITAGRNPKDFLSVLLEFGADINAKNESGYTPLIVAASLAKADSIHFLIDNGAEVHIPEHMGNNICDLLPVECYVEMLLDLMNKISVWPARRLGPIWPKFELFLSDFEGCLEATPLLIAVWQGKKELAVRLRDLGFLTKKDILWLPGNAKLRDKLPVTSIDTYNCVVSGLCSLKLISFVTVSEMLGNAPHRQDNVKQLGLPVPIQKQLLFKLSL